MSKWSSWPRRRLLAAAAGVAFGVPVLSVQPVQRPAKPKPARSSSRSQAALADLRTHRPPARRQTVADQSQGAQLAKLQELVRYWGSGYGRKAEAKLNALPQFTTNIDGVDIHFIHVRSRHTNALP